MTAKAIIGATLVPDTKSVFILGCFEKRVTLYAQQVRALNLVDAILDQRLVSERGKVAVVGGGVAGLTVTAAFAKAAPKMRVIDLFEQNTDVLELQRNSSRYLHPHLYDWPTAGADNPDAGLPLLTWSAGSAGEVAAAIRRQFDEIRSGSMIRVYTSSKVTGVTAFPVAGARVLLDAAPTFGGVYDIVILSIGFGYEAHLSGETPSYWSPPQLTAPILGTPDPPVIFVSGNGDGGLVDFMIAAFDGLTHKEICELITGLSMGAALQEVMTIEREAWAGGADVDLFNAYRTRVRSLVPTSVWTEIHDRMRPAATVWLHTREARLFKRTSALLNRIGAWMIIEADANFNRNQVVVRTGIEFIGDVPVTGPVQLEGEATFTPLRRLLRLGPDLATNIAPFEALVDRFRAGIVAPIAGLRPSTPPLSSGALARFPKPADNVAASPAPTTPPAPQRSLRVEQAADGTLLWSGNLEPVVAAQVWRDDQITAIDCGVAVADAGPLLGALARLSGHAHNCDLYCRDRRRWEDVLIHDYSARILPSPYVSFRFRVHDARTGAQDAPATPYNGQSLAEILHEALDIELLEQLHDALFDCLSRTPPVPTGWEIEPQLRQRMWMLWNAWRIRLGAGISVRRRFLLLLATERDHQSLGLDELCRLGPKILRPYLLKATLFALAFTIGSGRDLAPAACYPGNISDAALTGHASGVAWIDEREVGPDVASRPWTTGVVLLSELKSAFQQLQGEPRLNRGFDRLMPLIDEPGPAERPLVLGGDSVFQKTLIAGEQAVAEYLARVFQSRTAAAEQSLES